MPVPDFSRFSDQLPAFRGIYTQAIATDDVVFAAPVALQAISTGNLVVVCDSGHEYTATIGTAGDSLVGPGGGLVLVKTIKGSSTVTSVIVGVF